MGTDLKERAETTNFTNLTNGQPWGQTPRVSNNKREKEFRNEFSFSDRQPEPSEKNPANPC